MERIDIIKALENGGLFEFISTNWWRLDKEELKDIVKELDYAVYEIVTRLDYKDIKNDMIDSLKDIWEEDLE